MQNWRKIKSGSQEILEKFLVREQVLKGLRAWFEKEGFHEVETPLLLPIATTEPYYDVFETKLQLFNREPQPAFLAPSPEFQMKKLLATGKPELQKIFQISKVMRNNEGLSGGHNSEFTMLEYYRGGGVSYEKLMTDMDDLLLWLRRWTAGEAGGQELTTLKYQGKEYDLGNGCQRLSITDAFAKYAKMSVEEMLDEEKILEVGTAKGYLVVKDGPTKTTWEEMFNQILLNEVEPYLGQERPTILDRYPAQQAALARLCPDDSRFAERFELWLGGLELANAYGELIDADEQEKRCQNEIEQCQKLGKTYVRDYDRDFIEALRATEEECAGVAIGVDRLVMLLADVSKIEEVTFFPTTELFEDN